MASKLRTERIPLTEVPSEKEVGKIIGTIMTASQKNVLEGPTLKGIWGGVECPIRTRKIHKVQDLGKLERYWAIHCRALIPGLGWRLAVAIVKNGTVTGKVTDAKPGVGPLIFYFDERPTVSLSLESPEESGGSTRGSPDE